MMFSQNDKYSDVSLKLIIQIHQRVLFSTLFRKYHVESDTSDPVFNVKVISWIINYGHTHLLQEIVNHVECNNLSISLVFGLNNADSLERLHLLISA
jgi:hypothetical protein